MFPLWVLFGGFLLSALKKLYPNYLDSNYAQNQFNARVHVDAWDVLSFSIDSWRLTASDVDVSSFECLSGGGFPQVSVCQLLPNIQ